MDTTPVDSARPGRTSVDAATADPPVEVQRSRRRTRTATAYWRDGTIVVVLPHRVAKAQAESLTANLVSRLLARRNRRPGDTELTDRARRLSGTYLEPVLGYTPEPASVTWVTNQNSRWGSCTVPDRTIRLSHRLQPMPDWVVDYVLLHELAHLVHPDHSTEFWRLLSRYPRTERARGYLDGWSDAKRS